MAWVACAPAPLPLPIPLPQPLIWQSSVGQGIVNATYPWNPGRDPFKLLSFPSEELRVWTGLRLGLGLGPGPPSPVPPSSWLIPHACHVCPTLKGDTKRRPEVFSLRARTDWVGWRPPAERMGHCPRYILVRASCSLLVITSSWSFDDAQIPSSWPEHWAVIADAGGAVSVSTPSMDGKSLDGIHRCVCGPEANCR